MITVQKKEKNSSSKSKKQGKKGVNQASPQQNNLASLIQPKLEVGASNDKFEREADQVANNVISGSKKTNHISSLVSSENAQAKQSSDSVDSSINTPSSSGLPLPDDTRSFMEESIGADFSNVRIHTGKNAQQSSESIQAKAFTHNNDIYFNKDQYQPQTTEGKRLLAHELTHTVQQTAGNQTSSTSKIQKADKEEKGKNLWEKTKEFGGNVSNMVGKTVEKGKDWIMEQLQGIITKIPGYSLLAVVIGHDPILNTPVARNGYNFINAGLDIIPFGAAYKAKLEERGVLHKAAAWLDEQILELGISPSATIGQIKDFISNLSAGDFVQPGKVLERLKAITKPPFDKIIRFTIDVAAKFLSIVKSTFLNSLTTFVRDQTPGYELLTVILGRDPISKEPVERSAANIIRGFMCLIPGGAEKFDEIYSTGAIQRLGAWINKAVKDLGLSWNYIVNLFVGIWNSFSLEDLVKPFQAFARVAKKFGEPVKTLFNFVIEVVKRTVMVILEIMQFPVETVQSIMENASQAFEDIKKDPIAFLINLLRAIKQGFSQFFNNITTHLVNGLKDWLFEEISSAGINPPADLSFKSVLGFTLDVLGITVDNILDRLAKKIGPEKVEKIRGAMDKISGAWTFIKDVMERGPIAIWVRIQEQLSNLWDTLLGFIRDWLMEKIIDKAIAKVLSMLDPTGIMAVVNSCIALFRAIQTLMEKVKAMLEIVNSFVIGVAELAKGKLTIAANYLENALAGGIPIAISFLANQVGLRNLGTKIKEMISGVREKINVAIDWLIDKTWSTSKNVLNGILGKKRKKGKNKKTSDEISNERLSPLNSLNEQFNDISSDTHTLYFRGNNNPELVVESEPEELGEFLKRKQEELPKHDPQHENITTAKGMYKDLKKLLRELALSRPATQKNPTQQDPHSKKFEEVKKKYEEIMAFLSDKIEIDSIVYPDMVLPPFTRDLAKSIEAEFIHRDALEPFAFKQTNVAQHGATPKGWNELAKAGLTTGRGERWVRMHILTHRLNGQSTESNLTPARSTLNNPKFLDLEEDAYRKVHNDPNLYIWYRVEISYQNVQYDKDNLPFLKSLHAKWGTYDPTNNMKKIQHKKAKVPSLTTNVAPPSFSGKTIYNINDCGQLSILRILDKKQEDVKAVRYANFVADQINTKGGYNTLFDLIKDLQKRKDSSKSRLQLNDEEFNNFQVTLSSKHKIDYIFQ